MFDFEEKPSKPLEGRIRASVEVKCLLLGCLMTRERLLTAGIWIREWLQLYDEFIYHFHLTSELGLVLHDVC